MSDQESAKERATRILLESLDDSSIIEGHNSYTWQEYFQGRVEFYWENDPSQGLVLVVESAEVEAGQIRSVVALDQLSETVAEMFPNDDDAAMAWEEVFHYFLFTLDPLTQLYISLERRRIGLLPKGKDMQAKMFYEQTFQPMEAELEARRLRLFKYLQGEFRRGGSEARIPVSDQQCALLATEFPALQRHWRRVKKWQLESADNWRDHAKVDFKDTPDDLLDRLDGKVPANNNEDYPGIPAVLALEHAARRCGLPANIYSYSTLKNLRTRGNSVLRQMNRSDLT
jgi:hypothetical protein